VGVGSREQCGGRGSDGTVVSWLFSWQPGWTMGIRKSRKYNDLIHTYRSFIVI